MKRFFVVLLVCMMIVPSALAFDLDGYNNIATTFGANALNKKTAQKIKSFTSYSQDDCTISFEETGNDVTTIIIDGKGDSFIAYCCASFYLLDPSGDAKTDYGEFLAAYLMAHSTKDEYTYGETTNGIVFFIQPENNQFSFMVMK